MKGNSFIDSNICIYLFDSDKKKSDIAYSLFKNNPIISTQVIAESINVLIKKLKFTKQTAFDSANFIMNNTDIKLINTTTLKKAFEISLKYNFSFFDSMIIASALENNCTILYSEDMHHNQLIENKLTIINPFL
ncbi:MAG: hypothetical protein A2033_18855 [Bacteroidetes bacterium GWA2_31_9]|nr:MAG: hypothetical protein A2033_18855 [Bacteroidetes bacterium GWA2_31_9]